VELQETSRRMARAGINGFKLEKEIMIATLFWRIGMVQIVDVNLK
jgi:hypothetical protein